MLVFSLYSLVDGIFVAIYVGEDALAAINIAMPFVNTMFAIAVLLSVGASTAAAIHLGAGESDEASGIFSQNTVVVAVIAVTLTALVQLFTPSLAALLGAEGDNFDHVVRYIRTVSLFAFCFMVSYSMEVMVKTDGHPNLSVIGVVSTCIVHIALDVLFVAKLGMGVTGAALATGTAQLAATVFYFVHFLSGRSRLKLKPVRIRLSLYKRLLPLGMSEFLSEMSLAVTVFLYNRALLSVMGPKGTVSFAVISYVNQIALVLMAGVAQGMEPLVSYELGAGREQNCRGYYRMALFAAACLSTVAFVICQLFAPSITNLLLEGDSSVFSETVEALRWFSLSFLVAGFNLVSAGYLSAIERPWLAAWVSPMRALVLLLPSMYIMTALLGADGIWFSSVLAELMCAVVTLFLLRRARRTPIAA